MYLLILLYIKNMQNVSANIIIYREYADVSANIIIYREYADVSANGAASVRV